jgi:hypothetical protein
VENAPVISIALTNPAPGTDKETWERYGNWIKSNNNLLATLPEIRGIDRYVAVRDSPEYPLAGSINHYRRLEEWEKSYTRQERTRVQKDLKSWQDRKIMEYFWSVNYQLRKSYRADPVPAENNSETMIERCPLPSLRRELQFMLARWTGICPCCGLVVHQRMDSS